MEFIFWASVLLIIWAYAGYPLSLYGLNKLVGKDFRKSLAFGWPNISIIIAAANEEEKIISKLLNTVALKYPSDKIEYIITLDGATDRTVELVDQFMNDNPHLKLSLIENDKGGKEAAQLAAVEAARGDILVFTDVATRLGKSTLEQLISNFSDPRVGAVDGMSKIDKEGSNEGLYLKYENLIRRYESRLGSLVTLGGCLFAVRRGIVQDEFYVNETPIPGFRPDRQSDFRTALMTKLAGFQAILDEDAVAHFDDIEDSSKEFSRKHRTVVRGMANFFDHAFLLDPYKHGLFAYQLFCHKFLKWIVPFLMITALTSSLALIPGSSLYTFMFAGQVMFYLLAWRAHKHQLQDPVFKIISFFVMTNLAIFKAWVSYAKGERFVMWTPSKR